MTITVTPPSRATIPGATPTAAPATVPLTLDWPIGTGTGPELMALHLTTKLRDTPAAHVMPVVNAILHPGAVDPAMEARVVRAFATASATVPRLMQEAGENPLPLVALQLLGRTLGGQPATLPMTARRNVGIVQTCDTRFDATSRTRARAFDALLAGSAWMRERLLSAGIANVGVYPAGIDTTLFAPGQKSGHLAQRFVIFSGGRLHHHKGQDLVIAAVRAFRKRHPETLLLTTWQTPWPESVLDIALAGHVQGAPDYRGVALDITSWCADNGLPAGSVVDLGTLAPAALAVVLRECSVALFPNRAETDGNPMLLECMATGVPVIAAANTGQLDVASDAHCYLLRDQQPVRGPMAGAGTEGWGESSVDEIVAQLEAVYTRTSEARARAAAAMTFAQAFGWEAHAPRLLDLLAPLIRDLQPR